MKPQGILRYAQTLEQVIANYYLIPKETSTELLIEAVQACLPAKELNTMEEVVEFIEQILEYVTDKIER